MNAVVDPNFTDYKVFRYNPLDSLPLSKVYTKYNDLSIEYVDDLTFENIEVELLKK